MRLFRGSSGVPRDSDGRITDGALALIIVGLALSFQHRELVVGQVLYFEDVAAYFEPLWRAAARAMRSGTLPVYAPQAWSGQPLLGDPQIGVLYPPYWLWLIVDPLRAYALSVVAHAVLAAAGSYALARELGRSQAAAATAALCLSLSAYFVLEERHLMFLASAAWIPWLLRAIARQAQASRPSAIAGIALAVCGALLAGGWSMLVFAAPVVAIFVVARLRGSGTRTRALGIALGLFLGLMLAGVALLPAVVHARLSPRALPLAESFAGSYAWPSLRYAITLVLPLWYGDDARGSYVGAPDQWELCGYGSGLVAAALALVALLRRRGRVERALYVALIALAVLAALGPAGPLWSVWRSLPLLSQARCPARGLFVYTLVLPLLAAAGVDRLRARLRARMSRRARRVIWLAPILVAVELLVSFRAENPTVPLEETRRSPEVLAAIPREGAWGRTLIDVHLGQAFHNGGLRWDLESPGGYSSLPLWRYLHFLWIANHGEPYPGWPHPALAHDLTAQGLWTLSSPLVDLLNVRWLLAPRDRPPRGSGWTRLAAGDDAIDLWRNEEALPRAFLVHRLRGVADEAGAARALGEPSFDPAHEAIVETPLELSSGGGEPPVVRELGRAADGARFSTEDPGEALLVYSCPYEPSWRVFVDGTEAPLLRVDYALMGVRVSGGAHEVSFQRIDRALHLGAAISGSALLLLLCLLLPQLRGRARAGS